jgi:hypothetical protein
MKAVISILRSHLQLQFYVISAGLVPPFHFPTANVLVSLRVFWKQGEGAPFLTVGKNWEAVKATNNGGARSRYQLQRSRSICSSGAT